DALRPLLHHHARLVLERGDAADATADDHARAVAVELRVGAIQTRPLHRLLRSRDRELREPVRAPRLLPVHVLLRLEALHLARETAVVVLCRFEMRDRAGTALPGDEGVPGAADVVAEGGDETDARHHHSAASIRCHGVCEKQGYSTHFSCRYLTAAPTCCSFSASSSGISIPNSSSNAIPSSTVSSESAPRSSTNEASSVTFSGSTPSSLMMISFTFASVSAMMSSL